MFVAACSSTFGGGGGLSGGGGGGGGGGGDSGMGSGAGGSVVGNLPGGVFDPADAISASVSMSDGNGGTTSAAHVVIASTASLCGDAAASPPIDRKQQRFITIDLTDVAGSVETTPTAPGTYTIYPNTGSRPAHSASLVTGALDTACQPIDADGAQAQSGTVTLTQVVGGVFKGTFDVTLNTGGQITGTFSPSACPALQTEASSMATHACQ